MDWLNKHTVLVLNSLYQPIGTISPKKAMIALNSTSDDGQCAAKAIDMRYPRLDDGKFDLCTVETFYTHTFEEWLYTDLREGLDKVIKTSHLEIRVPTVIMTRYSKMPMRKFRPTKALLFEMQQGICGYSGKKMPMNKMNIEHKIAKSEGGKDTFENIMLVDMKINSARGNKPLAEVGLTPLFKHKEPRAMPAAYAIRGDVHPDWAYWIHK